MKRPRNVVTVTGGAGARGADAVPSRGTHSTVGQADPAGFGHTPGPWVASGPYGRQEATAPLAVNTPGVFDIREKSETVDGRVHTQVHVGTMHAESMERARANARLIAAAPDLLAACRLALAKLEALNEEHNATAVALEAAIAKATGGAS